MNSIAWNLGTARPPGMLLSAFLGVLGGWASSRDGWKLNVWRTWYKQLLLSAGSINFLRKHQSQDFCSAFKDSFGGDMAFQNSDESIWPSLLSRIGFLGTCFFQLLVFLAVMIAKDQCTLERILIHPWFTAGAYSHFVSARMVQNPFVACLLGRAQRGKYSSCCIATGFSAPSSWWIF